MQRVDDLRASKGKEQMESSTAVGLQAFPERQAGSNPLGRIVASLDRKRLGKGRCFGMENLRRGVFDKETRRKPLAFAADAGCYGI